MASIGYGQYNYGRGDYNNPTYHFASATIAETSGVSATGRLDIIASATIAQTLSLIHI